MEGQHDALEGRRNVVLHGLSGGGRHALAVAALAKAHLLAERRRERQRQSARSKGLARYREPTRWYHRHVPQVPVGLPHIAARHALTLNPFSLRHHGE